MTDVDVFSQVESLLPCGMKQLTGLQIKGFWIETVAGWWDSEAKLMIRDLTYHPLRIQTAPKLQVVFLRRNQIMVQLENDESGQIIFATLHDRFAPKWW